ncbi:MAG: transglycosylase domain-containing protein [Lachnospiraceae bacterium]|nr:transglycosylase domain-containing protein [Lachnospiraceae bacterium]
MSKKKKEKKKKKGFLHTVGKSIMLLLLMTVLLLMVIIYFRYGRDVIAMRQAAKLLVKLSNTDTFCSVQSSVVYDVNEEEIRSLSGEKDLYYVKYADIPQQFFDAIISVEDKKFYRHHGLDSKGITRAGIALIQHNGEITQGGSTITQQLAKNIFLTNEVSWKRKVIEAFTALELEKRYSKEQILEFYLNNIYFANGYYGIAAAANGYFQQELTDLSLSQIAFLCAIPNSPDYYNPISHIDHTLERRDKILLDMVEEGYINNLDYTIATSEEITLNMKTQIHSNYAETYIYNQATEALMQADGFQLKYDFSSDLERQNYNQSYDAAYTEYQKTLYTGGYRIYTSMNLETQDLLQEQLDDVLSDYEEVNEEGVFALQGSAVCIDNVTGYVCAIVGGRTQENIKGYTLNRAYQSPRQPGSAIKPLNVYLPAFEQGYNLDSKVTAYDDEGEEKRVMRIDEAVARSNNDIARQIYREITPQRGMSYLAKMKFKSIVPADKEVMAGALGGFTYGVTTEEMAAAFAAIANNGAYRVPGCIIKITNAQGDIIYENKQETTQVYDKNAAAMMTSALEGVLEKGGTAEGYGLKNMHCAGKTGTTNKNYDGWFCGFSPYYTTAVWVGYDMPRQLKGLQGNTYPVRIWNHFMAKLHEGLEDAEFSEFYYMPEKEEVEITTEKEEQDKKEEPKKTTEQVTEATTEQTTATTEQTTTEAPTTEEQFEDEKEIDMTTEAEPAGDLSDV